MFFGNQRGDVRKGANAGGVALLTVMFALFSTLSAIGQTASGSRAKRPAGTKSTAETKEAPGTRDTGPQITGWVLKFADEFEEPALDFSKWSPHSPGRVALAGVNDWMAEAVQVSGGQLHIAARGVRGDSGVNYTSGIVTTVATFAQTYGRFEIRFRMPAGRGLEPCFQLLPVPAGEFPSIDVLHILGNDPSTALFANRWMEGPKADSQADRSYSGSYRVADFSAGFHIVAVEWDAEEIVWMVDGVARFHSFEGVPHQPMYLAVSLAVGGGDAGEPDARTKFPAVFDVDYVRVFARP
jgi:beta-glucanase (GH16 family)